MNNYNLAYATRCSALWITLDLDIFKTNTHQQYSLHRLPPSQRWMIACRLATAGGQLGRLTRRAKQLNSDTSSGTPQSAHAAGCPQLAAQNPRVVWRVRNANYRTWCVSIRVTRYVTARNTGIVITHSPFSSVGLLRNLDLFSRSIWASASMHVFTIYTQAMSLSKSHIWTHHLDKQMYDPKSHIHLAKHPMQTMIVTLQNQATLLTVFTVQQYYNNRH